MAVFNFIRPIDTNDLNRDLSFESERYLMFARGPLDNSNDISYHDFKTTSEDMFDFQCGKFCTLNTLTLKAH